MSDRPITTERLDSLILPTSRDAIPTRNDVAGWLHVSQVALTNIRGLVSRGKSESAEAVAAHYWTCWAGAKKQ